MSPENKRCKAYPGVICESECFLIGQFISQSEKGGTSTDELTINQEVGPYWSKKNWSQLVENNLKFSKMGCACKNEFESIIAAITNAKTKKGEIVEKNTGRNFPQGGETSTRNDTEPLK